MWANDAIFWLVELYGIVAVQDVEYYNISTAIEYLIDKIKVITYSADY